jgi:SAM-dependent methyltransferase
MTRDLEQTFGHIDIYLFDPLLRGRITPKDRLVEVGCGWGRNLVYLMRAGGDVYGIDPDPDAIAAVRTLAADVAPHLSPDRFRVEPVEQSTLPPAAATVVVSSAVLHFAADEGQFAGMLEGSWRLLRSGGVFFCRLASTIGLESRVQPRAVSRRFRLPDGTDRFLVDEALLMTWTSRLGGQLLDPLKTTVVQDQRAMTTWVVRKH